MELSFRLRFVSEVKCPSGDISLMELFARPSVVSAVNPLKSPDFSDVMRLPDIESEVIAARCAVVTLAALLTPGTAATIASRICCVRSLSGGSIIVSSTSVILIVTVIVSVPPLPSETETVTV